jgi:nicotinate phosphoribosyltransferase
MSPLLTDLYQLTMAQGYFLCDRAADQAVFHLFFRKLPFAGGYAVAAGLEPVLDFVASFAFEEADTAYLAELSGADGGPLFRPEFLAYLRGLRLSVDIDAMPEGTLVFPHEPLLRVCGSLLEAQLLETALLNLINFQTLIATKAARVCEAAAGAPVLEMGLRRAQGVDGALAASRAAYLGGCAATSNVLAGKRYGIPVRGTHAHSWVMAFDSEIEAFQAYAAVMPNNSLFLVDTYDTLAGVRHAIEVAKDLRASGHELLGVRLDSGDLAWLSTHARKLLDEAGFEKAAIVATNDLDEHLIESLRHQGAAVAVWGVGTKLVTAYDQPALGGVYKLSMVGAGGGPLQPRIKLSEDPVKMSNPGVQQVRRFSDGGKLVADAIYDETRGIETPARIVDPLNTLKWRELDAALTQTDLLVPVVRGGHVVADRTPLEAIRDRTRASLAALDPTIKRLVNPHVYPVGLESKLFEARMDLYQRARASAHPGERPA